MERVRVCLDRINNKENNDSLLFIRKFWAPIFYISVVGMATLLRRRVSCFDGLKTTF